MNKALQQLKLKTEGFWDKLERYGLTTELFIDEYIGDLLPREMEEGEEQPYQSTCDILVLLVGFSYEPLLQSICYYAPKSVLLVLNKKYGDKNAAEIRMPLEKLIKALSKKGLISHNVTVLKDLHNKPISHVGDKPEQVFRFLCEHLIYRLRDEKRVIIDVTGAKKSMGTGAYLFGAYTNTPISYVDFGKYNISKGRPYGYSHRIGLLENPYEAFQLRNWEEVKSRYQKYAFRPAYQLLGQIKIAMESSLEKSGQGDEGIKLFDPKHVEAVNKLIEVLKFYEKWDNGDYHGANDAHEELKSKLPGFLPPYAVEVLGTYWPHGDDMNELLNGIGKIEMGDDQTPPLYVRNPDLLVYVKDELKKIERLIEINLDYRSALIRSVGLGEVLLKARITCLWDRGLLEIAESDPETQKPKCFYPMDRLPTEIMDWKDDIRNGVVLETRIARVILALRARPGKKEIDAFYCQKGQGKQSMKSFFFVRRCHSGAPLVDKKIFFKDEQANLRHKAAHTYLSIPRTIAEEVYDKAKENFKDFVINWQQFMRLATRKVNLDDSLRFKIVDWDLLCKWCGINEFLPLLPGAEKEES